MDNINFLEALMQQKEDYKRNFLEKLYKQNIDAEALVDELKNNLVLREIDNTINALSVMLLEAKAQQESIFEFTYDFHNATSSEYKAITNFFIDRGFIATGDTDFISSTPISRARMTFIENELVDTHPWFLQKANKAYDATLKENSNALLRLLDRQREHERLPFCEVSQELEDDLEISVLA